MCLGARKNRNHTLSSRCLENASSKNAFETPIKPIPTKTCAPTSLGALDAMLLIQYKNIKYSSVNKNLPTNVSHCFATIIIIFSLKVVL